VASEQPASPGLEQASAPSTDDPKSRAAADREHGVKAGQPEITTLHQATAYAQNAHGLSPDEVQKVVRASIGNVAACYKRYKPEAPELAWQVSWHIKPDGSVERVEIDGPTVGQDALKSCLLEVVRGLRFPRAVKGTSVNIPYVLRWRRDPGSDG
jgi:outer membrane biosynthesis protein TonB